jgi:hypothetical protein
VQQIRADTQKALQQNVQRENSFSVQQTISDLREAATKVVSRPIITQESQQTTTLDEIREIVPMEMTKLR